MGTSGLAQWDRSSGILLHITSLPSAYGIGDLGPAAMQFVELLCAAGQTWWQMLPLVPPGHGNSPYNGYSAFAGNPDLISPELLVSDGLLDNGDLPPDEDPSARVDFEKSSRIKRDLIARAWERMKSSGAGTLRTSFERFRRAERDWLDDFALFSALRDSLQNDCWVSWPKELAFRDRSALASARRSLKDEIDRHAFAQFVFYRQLQNLRAFAGTRGVRLLGDLPMFVSADSADVWARPDQFLLDRNLRPTAVAGVPPDYFSRTGQRWGNPLYDWRAMKRDGFRWWIARMKSALRQADVVRIDHFRGLQACWTIPARAKTAKTGKWVASPGAELLGKIRATLKGLPVIAEDLGLITPAVEQLRDQFELPGMRVLQFAFGGDAQNPFLPHNHFPNTVAYTGTHDNDTTLGWYASLNEPARRQLAHYAPDAERDPVGALLRLTWGSVARIAIAPLQDILRLGPESRMNMPGSSTGNWAWRIPPQSLSPQRLDELAILTETFGRSNHCSDSI